MSKQSNKFEVVDITRRCFPKGQPITVTGERNTTVTLNPGELVTWRVIGDTFYFLRNAHWFRKLTVHFVKPIKGNGNGEH